MAKPKMTPERRLRHDRIVTVMRIKRRRARFRRNWMLGRIR